MSASLQCFRLATLLACITVLCIGNSLWAADKVNWEEAPIRYSDREPVRNAIVRLQEQIDAAKINLEHRGEQGYLQSILTALNIPESSQVLVFSKTSLQDDKISPERPRAIYFNDETHVGFVRDGVVEIATADADLGMVFYTLDPDQVERPKFIRQANRCLSCHGAARTKGVPGLLVRSVYPSPKGEPVIKAGSFLSNHRSPLQQRWGGWYVSGLHGDQQHLGNYLLRQESKPKSFDNFDGMNRPNLHGLVDTQPYLNEHSDVVALMVLEHQIEAYNLLTQANFVTQHALWEMEKATADGADQAKAKEAAQERVRKAAQPLVHYLLFAQEAKLTSPISGTSTFQTEFQNRIPGSASVAARQFDLQKRMFKVRCSYLIYSRAFADQPLELRIALARELIAATEEDYPSAKLVALSDEERLQVRTMLQTSPPAWFAECL